MENNEGPAYAFISTTSTTFHPENPLENAIIDNPGLVRRRRRKTSARELEVLEMAFKENEKPSKEIRDEIARKTGMDTKAVQVTTYSPMPNINSSSAESNDRSGSKINDNRHDGYRNQPQIYPQKTQFCQKFHFPSSHHNHFLIPTSLRL